MKKYIKNGVKYIENDMDVKFINERTAFLAAQCYEFLGVKLGYLTCTTFSPEHHKFEVTFYLEDKQLPRIPVNYPHTAKVITSHEYWQEFSKKVVRVRSIEFKFNY